MIKTFISCFLLSIWLSVHSQYHQVVLFDGDSGLVLLSKLVQNYKPSVVLDYSMARVKMYKQIYNVHDSVHCVYSDHTLYLDPTSTDPIGYLAKSGNANGINCEHTFPQSKGADIGNARSDMHHLFPSRAEVNSARSNFPFGEITDSKTDHWYYKTEDLQFIPSSHIDLYSESIDGLFEPMEAHKGNVARAIFYFFTMYDLQADKTFFESMKLTLCDWHLKDPVDSAEYTRSLLIGSYQENKANPFVLDCSLAQRTYCPNSKKCAISSSTQNYYSYNFKIYPNPNDGNFRLRYDPFIHLKHIRITSSIGKEISLSYQTLSDNEFQVQLNHNEDAGIYTLHIETETGEKFSQLLVIL